MVLFATPAQAYQILSIPPGSLSLIVCGNGNVFPWDGPNADAIAVGLCQGTVIPNVVFDIRKVDVKRLLREHKPAKFEEDAEKAPHQGTGPSLSSR